MGLKTVRIDTHSFRSFHPIFTEIFLNIFTFIICGVERRRNLRTHRDSFQKSALYQVESKDWTLSWNWKIHFHPKEQAKSGFPHLQGNRWLGIAFKLHNFSFWMPQLKNLKYFSLKTARFLPQTSSHSNFGSTWNFRTLFMSKFF